MPLKYGFAVVVAFDVARVEKFATGDVEITRFVIVGSEAFPHENTNELLGTSSLVVEGVVLPNVVLPKPEGDVLIAVVGPITY